MESCYKDPPLSAARSMFEHFNENVYEGRWGTICNDVFKGARLDISELQTNFMVGQLCENLGYSPVGEFFTVNTFHPIRKFSVRLRINMGHFEVIHIPNHRHLLSINHLIRASTPRSPK